MQIGQWTVGRQREQRFFLVERRRHHVQQFAVRRPEFILGHAGRLALWEDRLPSAVNALILFHVGAATLDDQGFEQAIMCEHFARLLGIGFDLG